MIYTYIYIYIYILLNLIIIIIIIIIKINFQTHGFNPTQPNPCGLGWTYVMGWVGSKNPLNPTHVLVNFPTHLKKKKKKKNYFSSFVPLIFQELSCNNFPTYLKKLLVMTFNFFFFNNLFIITSVEGRFEL